MDIEYYGANCFRISNKKASLVTDDNLDQLGVKSVIKSDDIELRTFVSESSAPKGRMMIDQPGEYEVSGVSVIGIAARAHMDEPNAKTTTIYKVVIDDIKIAITGHIYPELSDDQLESIGTVDVLLIPLGGSGYTMDATGALKIIRKIEPKIVIPSHYADKVLRYEVPQQDLEGALKDLAMEPKERTAKLKLKSANIPVDGTQLIILERQ